MKKKKKNGTLLNETPYKSYKSLFEIIKGKFKKTTTHKRYHNSKMDCYRRNKW